MNMKWSINKEWNANKREFKFFIAGAAISGGLFILVDLLTSFVFSQ